MMDTGNDPDTAPKDASTRQVCVCAVLYSHTLYLGIVNFVCGVGVVWVCGCGCVVWVWCGSVGGDVCVCVCVWWGV